MTLIKPVRRWFFKHVLAASGALVLAGCDRLSRSELFPRILEGGEKLSDVAQHLMTARQSLAQEFTAADLSPVFRSNGTANPENLQYQAPAANAFADYRLQVGGLVEQPGAYSLAELRALPSRTQITRHDCVEGWSAIGKWKGARLSALLARVRPTPDARYVVFFCADPIVPRGAC